MPSNPPAESKQPEKKPEQSQFPSLGQVKAKPSTKIEENYDDDFDMSNSNQKFSQANQIDKKQKSSDEIEDEYEGFEERDIEDDYF